MNLIEQCLNDQIDEIRSKKGKVLDSAIFTDGKTISVCTDGLIKGQICYVEHIIS